MTASAIPRKELRERFIQQAESYVGYTASAGRDNIFGDRLNIKGQPWDGMFIDVVAREVGMRLQSHTYSPVALAEYIGSGFFHVRPRRGDIVFFQTSTVSDFGSPHVGIVTDVTRWLIDGTFETVEGMTDSGQPRGAKTLDGVYKRTRHKLETVGFGRPRFVTASALAPIPDGVPKISPGQLRPGSKHKNVEIIQLALAKATGVYGLPRGHYDGRTRNAYAKFQRNLGYPLSSADGVPDFTSLQRLAQETGLFLATP